MGQEPSRKHRAASESVAFHIVEGCGASSRKEFARFLDISIKSTSELEYQLELSKDYGVLSENAWRELSSECVQIRRMLCGLRRAILAKDKEDRNEGLETD